MEGGCSSDGLLELKPEAKKVVEEKPKVVVIMGPTGSGKSKLAIDLAAHFPIEIINADSMQVYRGLDVLTNKVPLHEQKGVPHHLLGTVNPNVGFTAKAFRDSAIPLINDILSRNCVPVIVGGTNYYIQALVSPFLLDDTAGDMDESCLNHLPGDEQTALVSEFDQDRFDSSYENLKDIDPVAAKRVHPNNHRKINQYLNLYARSGILPSKLYQGKAAENWGRTDNCRFSCCFICIDATLPVLDQYVGERVDCMIDAGLLGEVYEIYSPNSDYTRGLRQAIGVREFEEFLGFDIMEANKDEVNHKITMNTIMMKILHSSDDNQLKFLLTEAIEKVKANTRRLVRRQKRRLTRLQTLFGWNMHYVDATASISGRSEESWAVDVVEPAVKIVRSFLSNGRGSVPLGFYGNGTEVQRNLWTQYICKACGDRVLRGAYEWEQHKQGRGHRKRISRLKKSQAQGFFSSDSGTEATFLTVD
ncbi:hypothetical protein K2173_021006 [Erythroxylum novogranatense]|uniref:tRNA dimethylallyltransferase 2 n=1 Tax=Erythroxylum novogranatense TaxID=1862640 RepID=A0AAV8TME3_9ROSI|nr:hypothetical protein K2173_021006 [Erythroxylum novogranatense]